MKNFNNTSNRVWGIALLAALVGAPIVTATATAAPDPNPRSYGRNDRRNDNDNQRDDNYVGTVTNVRSGNSFDLNANGRTYNVYTAGSLPRGLSRGDRVSVRGNSDGKRGNDIRRADVSILDNNRNDPRRDNDRNDYESPRNYRGTVAILLPNNEFNARIDGRIYKIYALESTRDLRVGDPITIYGQMDRGVNIRGARVTVENYRDNNWRDTDRDNNWRPGGYDNSRDFDNYRGEVTDVRNNREFDVVMDGRTYNVYADNSTKRLSRGDIVRVTGKRTGSNDIREAQVKILRNR